MAKIVVVIIIIIMSTCSKTINWSRFITAVYPTNDRLRSYYLKRRDRNATYFQFPILVCFSVTVGHPTQSEQLLITPIFLLWPWTLIHNLDLRTWLDSVRVNQPAKYLGQRSSSSEVIVRTHRRTGLAGQHGPLQWSAVTLTNRSWQNTQKQRKSQNWQITTSVQSNLVVGRIANLSPLTAANVFFWSQPPSHTWFLEPAWVSHLPPPTPRTASGSVQLFLHSTSVGPTHRQTHRPRYMLHL